MASADIVHIMAGPIAQAIHDTAADVDGWQSTIEDAADWLSREADNAIGTYDGDASGTDWWQVDKRIPLLGRRWRLHLDNAFTLADHIVRSHQAHVDALTGALVERRKLDGQAAWDVLDSVGDPV